MKEFDYLTPYELALIVETRFEKEESELKERLTLVWLGEYYHRTKRLPRIKDELKKISGENQKVMSDDEMLETVKRLNKQFGGTYVKGGE